MLLWFVTIAALWSPCHPNFGHAQNIHFVCQIIIIIVSFVIIAAYYAQYADMK